MNKIILEKKTEKKTFPLLFQEKAKSYVRAHPNGGIREM